MHPANRKEASSRLTPAAEAPHGGLSDALLSTATRDDTGPASCAGYRASASSAASTHRRLEPTLSAAARPSIQGGSRTLVAPTPPSRPFTRCVWCGTQPPVLATGTVCGGCEAICYCSQACQLAELAGGGPVPRCVSERVARKRGMDTVTDTGRSVSVRRHGGTRIDVTTLVS